jgi:hypothetical protein
VPLAAASNAPSDAEVEAFVISALRGCIAAYSDAGYGLSGSKILIHLEAAGIDRTDLTPTLRAIVDLLGGEEGQSRDIM